MQGLEVASDEADHLLHTANKRSCSVPHSVEKNGKLSSSSFFSIHQKLRQLYEEEVTKTSQRPLQNLRPSSHLLEKLVKQENLNTLVLNLYPGNKGYSLCLKMGGDNIMETAKFPYQEDQLLNYIDNEELPPAVSDLLERSHPELYYSGCVIVQIRDYRQTFPHYMCDTHHVLLRPSTQSVINDVNLITAEGEWTPDEKLMLESQLVLATQGPLCLDPSPAVGLAAQRIHHTKNILNTPSLRSAARRHNQISANRKRKLDQFTNKPLPHLADFLARRKSQPAKHAARSYTQQNVAKQQKKNEQQSQVNYWADVHRFAKPLERPIETLDCTPLLVEEYILETERGPGRVYYIKLSILQRPSNCEYLGQLYVDKEYREGESNGASCRFSLGSRAQANRYIQQFTEIFTEEGRKSVRITHVVPGQPARVICTAGMRERDAKMAAQSLLQQQQQTLKQVLTAMSQQQMKLQKAVQAQKEQLVQQTTTPSQSQVQIQVPNVSGHLGQSSEACSNSVLSNVTLNGLGLISLLNPTSSQNGSVANGDVAPKIIHTPVAATQPSKPVIMTNPAISALANDFENSAHQYQQQAAAAAAANAAASAAANSVNSNVSFINHHTGSTSNNHGNTAILSLLNSNTPNSATVANPTLNHLLNNVISSSSSQQQQKLLTKKMTLTNILNSRLLTPSSSASTSSPVRVSLQSLTNQLSSPPLTQQKLVAGRIVQASLAGNVQTQTQTVQTLAPGSVKYSGNIQGLSGNVQTIRRLSTVTTQDSSPPTSSLGMSMPGLSALLAGTPSADNPIPGAGSSGSSLLERLSTPPSYSSSSPKPPPAPSPSSLNLNLASLQGAMASIPGLQNVQVSIPGLAVPISVSLNVSTPHIVTSLPVSATPVTMSTANIATVSVSNSPGVTMVFTNANQAQLMASGKNPNAQQTLRSPTTVSACNITGAPSIQLLGTLQRPRGVVTTTNKPTLMARSVVNTQRPTLKVAPVSAVVSSSSQMTMSSGVGNTQVLTLSPQQHLQIQALQKQAQLQLQVQQQPSALAIKHRRRSNTADNK